MNKIKEEILETIGDLIKTSRALPSKGSVKEIILLLPTLIYDFLCPSFTLTVKSVKLLGSSKKSKRLTGDTEYKATLNRIVEYKIFSPKNLEMFDNKVDEIKIKHPYEFQAVIKDMKDSIIEYLEYQKDRSELIGAYLPVLGIAFITLLFICAYGKEFIFSKEGSILLALVISYFTCKTKFEITYDISVARHVKLLLERIENKI
jgi:hypothetical protein